MLGVTVRTAAMLSLKFNPIKSYCVAIGQLSRIKLDPMMLDSSPIEWVNSLKYLGVTIVGG
jgi:hypothetical protein